MARIPNEQIERIKQDISLLRLVESQGYQVTKQGKDYAVCCPFHEERQNKKDIHKFDISFYFPDNSEL